MKVEPKFNWNNMDKENEQEIPSMIEYVSNAEHLSKIFGVSLTARIGKSKILIIIPYAIIAFLSFYLGHNILCYLLIDDDDKITQILYGDFSGILGKRIFSILMQFVWSIHAIINLWLMKINSPHDWLNDIEMLWYKSKDRINGWTFDNRREYGSFMLKIRACLFPLILTQTTLVMIIYSITFMNYKSVMPYYMWIIYGIKQLLWSFLSALFSLTLMAQFCGVCHAIRIRFMEIYDDLEYIEHENRSITELLIKQIQHKHYVALEMVMRSNQFWKKYLFQFYIIFVSMCVIISYRIIFSDLTLSVRFICSVITIGGFMLLSVVSIEAAVLSISAHRPYHIVYGLMVRSDDPNIKNQV